MAQPSLERFINRAVVAKLEVTEGVDSVPVAATDGLLLMNGQSGTEVDVIERTIDRSFFTNEPFIVGNKRGFIEGEFELFSPAIPGTEPSVNDVLLRIAGMKRTYTVGTASVTGKTRYTPGVIAADFASASAYWWHVDKLLKVLGARAQLSRIAMAVGNRIMGQARIQGSYTDVTEQAAPAVVLYDDIPDVIRHDNTVTYITDVTGAGSPLLVWGKELSIDMGNELATKEYTSKKITAINDRRGTWTLRIARTANADFNPWTLRDAGNIISAYMQLDEGTGLYTQVGFRGQIEAVNLVDIEGDLGYELSGRCIASSAGGDEFWIEHGDTTAAGT